MGHPDINPWIQSTAGLVNNAARKGIMFEPGSKASQQDLEKFREVDKPVADYAELRGTLSLDQVDKEVSNYIGFLNSPQGEARKPVFLQFLQKGAEDAKQQNVDPYLATGKLLLTARGEGQNAPTQLERALGLDMMAASLSHVSQLSKQAGPSALTGPSA